MTTEETIKKINKLTQSKSLKIVLACIGIFIIVIFIFEIGEVVGFHEATFSHHFGDNYHDIFGEPSMMHPFGSHGDFVSGHGASGKVVKVDLPTLVIADTSNVEKVVSLNDDTIIRRMRDTITAKDIATGDTVVVFGSPNDTGSIDATFIRIVPAPPAGGPAINQLNQPAAPAPAK